MSYETLARLPPKKSSLAAFCGHTRTDVLIFIRTSPTLSTRSALRPTSPQPPHTEQRRQHDAARARDARARDARARSARS